MTRAALVNGGVLAFLAVLVLVLALMLIAVIRLPKWTDTHSEDDEPADSGALAPAWPEPGFDAPHRAGAGLRARARPAAPAPGRSRPAHAKHGHTRPAPAGPLPPSPVTGTSALSVGGPARSRPGGADLPARPGGADLPARPGGQVPWRGTVRAPQVSGSPPWEPAPRPPD